MEENKVSEDEQMFWYYLSRLIDANPETYCEGKPIVRWAFLNTKQGTKRITMKLWVGTLDYASAYVKNRLGEEE